MAKILVVDDSAAVRGLVAHMLVTVGHSVACAESGEDGAAMALSDSYDAFVSDLWMPGVSGLQMARLLRDDPHTAAVPLVLFTAAADAKTRFWAECSGADAVLEKRQVRDLPKVVARLLAKRPLRGATPAPRTPVDPATILARVGHVLERTLFDSVLASRVRSLALEHSDVAGLFDGLSELLVSIASARWLALEMEGKAYVAASPTDFAAVQRAIDVLGCNRGAPIRITRDDRCTVDHGVVLTADITHAQNRIARLALSLPRPHSERDGPQMFDRIARALALPLRLASLVEATQKRAMTDELTGLSNRRGAIEMLERSVAAAARYRLPLSVALFDVDHFKHVNDTHGHVAGDQALRHVAAILQRRARKSDLVARWGGEEFLAVLPSTGAAGAHTVAERLRAAVACSPVAIEGGPRFEVTISGGVATLGAERWQALVDRADRALYAAKEAGRNRVAVAEAIAKEDAGVCAMR